jgi:hypothetical protein
LISDERNSEIKDALRASVVDAQHDVLELALDEPVSGASEVKRLLKAYNRANDSLHRFNNSKMNRRIITSEQQRAFVRERRRLNRSVTDSARKLREAERLYNSRKQTNARRRAPSAYWQQQRINATDPGAPKLAGAASFLLDHQTDQAGVFVTSNPRRLKQRMRANREQLYSVPRLDAEGEQRIDTALAELHVENAQMCCAAGAQFAPRSAAALSAANPLAPSAGGALAAPAARAPLGPLADGDDGESANVYNADPARAGPQQPAKPPGALKPLTQVPWRT